MSQSRHQVLEIRLKPRCETKVEHMSECGYKGTLLEQLAHPKTRKTFRLPRLEEISSRVVKSAYTLLTSGNLSSY